MKKSSILSLLILLSFFSNAQIERKVTVHESADSSSNRQLQPGPEEMDKREMMKELNLTKEQRTKMKELHESGKNRRDAIFNNDKLSKEERQSQLAALRKEQLQGTMNILNEEQKQKLRSRRSEMRNEKPNKQ